MNVVFEGKKCIVLCCGLERARVLVRCVLANGNAHIVEYRAGRDTWYRYLSRYISIQFDFCLSTYSIMTKSISTKRAMFEGVFSAFLFLLCAFSLSLSFIFILYRYEAGFIEIIVMKCAWRSNCLYYLSNEHLCFQSTTTGFNSIV